MATYNNVKLIDELRLLFMDTSADATEQMLTDAQYKRFIQRNVAGTSQSYTLQQTGAGLYGLNPGQPVKAVLFSSYTTPFTGEGSNVYTVCEWGLIVEVTTGTHTGSVVITGTPIDFEECQAQICEYIGNFRAQLYANAVGSSNMTPGEASRILMDMASNLRGARAI